MWKWEADEPRGVMVMVHGAAEHHGRYKWLIEMWRSSGFHVLMGDLPGQGTSTRRSRGHIQSFDDYLFELKDWVTKAGEYNLPVFLLGHSMGGLVVIRSLQKLKLNVDGIILSSPCLGLVHTPPKFLDVLSIGLNVLAPSLKFDSNLSVDLATRNDAVKEMDVNDTLYITKVSVRWYRELLKSMELAVKDIQQLPDVPLLLMQGGDDKIVDKIAVKNWFNIVKSSEKTYKEWHGLYHEIFNEPEREDVFHFAMAFLELQLENRRIPEMR